MNVALLVGALSKRDLRRHRSRLETAPTDYAVSMDTLEID